MPGLNFEDVLSEALASKHDDGGARFWTGPAPAFFFPFGTRDPRPATIATVGSRAHQLRPAECRMPDAEGPIPEMLTARQMEAHEHLLSLGASLGPDFTARELRSAFRKLARRYHPDCHPGGPPSELARLTRVFAKVSEDYKILLAAVESRQTVK